MMLFNDFLSEVVIDLRNEVIDTVAYSPLDGIILNNTICKHSGKCLDNYRLGMLFSVDPAFDIRSWFNE